MAERLINADRLKRSFEANTPIAFQDCVPGIHAIIDLEQTVEVPRWIPVSERLPDFGVDVLLCNDEGVQVTAKRTGWSTDPNGWATNYCGYDYDSWDFMTNGDIVAWMELPKPYLRKEE